LCRWNLLLEAHDRILKVSFRESGQGDRNTVCYGEASQQGTNVGKVGITEKPVIQHPTEHMDEIEPVADLAEEENETQTFLD
jgi:hypothetical protein